MFKSPSNTGLVQGIDGTFRAASCKDLANVALNLFGDKNPVAVLSLGSGSLGVESFFALGGLQVFGLEHDPLKVLTGAMNVLIAEDQSVLTGGSLVLEMGDLKDLRMSSIVRLMPENCKFVLYCDSDGMDPGTLDAVTSLAGEGAKVIQHVILAHKFGNRTPCMPKGTSLQMHSKVKCFRAVSGEQKTMYVYAVCGQNEEGERAGGDRELFEDATPSPKRQGLVVSSAYNKNLLDKIQPNIPTGTRSRLAIIEGRPLGCGPGSIGSRTEFDGSLFDDSDDTAPEVALKESGLLWLPPTASKEPKAKSKATKKQGSTKTAKPTLKSPITPKTSEIKAKTSDITPKTSDITPKTSDFTPKTSASKTSAQAAPSPAERVARLRVGSKTRKVVKTDGAATADAIEEQTRRSKVERELANVKLDQLEKQNEAIAQIIEGPGKYFYKRSRKASGLTGSGFVLATAAAVKAGFPAGDQGRTWEVQQNGRDQPKLLAMAKRYLAEQDNNNEDYVMEDVSEEEAGYHSPTSEHEIDRCSQSYIRT